MKQPHHPQEVQLLGIPNKILQFSSLLKRVPISAWRDLLQFSLSVE